VVNTQDSGSAGGRSDLTSGWRRFLQLPLTRLGLATFAVLLAGVVAQLIVAVLPLGGATDWAAEAPLPVIYGVRLLLSAGLSVLLTYVAYRAYVRLVERRELSELAPTGGLRELGGGILFGALLFCLVIGVLAALGLYSVGGLNHPSILVLPLSVSMISGFVEEVLFRGVLFRIVEERLGTWVALTISAVLFGLLHLGNPNATLGGAVAIAVEAGVLLAAAYAFTRRLWLSIGIHFAWNFTQGGVFGVAVSGNEIPGLLQGRLSGPAWLSGGAFGAEASVVAIALCLAAGVFFIARAVQREQIVKPFWRSTPPA
jgi:membrane protease YdiL (CAAX protease family)